MKIRWALAGDGEQISPGGVHLDEVRSTILAQTAGAIEREIAEGGMHRFRFAWREEVALNAEADRSDDGRSDLRINTGTVARVYAVFLALLELPEFMREVPLGPRHESTTELARKISRAHLLGLSDPDVVAKRGADEVLFSLVVSEELARVNLGLALSNLALDFILWHELAHVVRGHLDLLPAGRRRMFQVWPAGPVPAEHRLIQTLEHDADTCAALGTAWTLIDQGSGFAWNPLPDLIDSHDVAMKLLILSLMILFFLFEADSPPEVRGVVHARPEVRFWNAMRATATVFSRLIPDGARRWTEAQQRALVDFALVSQMLGLGDFDPRASLDTARAEMADLDARVEALAAKLNPLRVIEIVTKQERGPLVPGGARNKSEPPPGA